MDIRCFRPHKLDGLMRPFPMSGFEVGGPTSIFHEELFSLKIEIEGTEWGDITASSQTLRAIASDSSIKRTRRRG
jgi:hypothetical protein